MSAEWDDLARLAEAAGKATHGLPWVKDPDAPDKVLASKDGGWDGSLVATVASDDFDLVEEDVTEFIAAANPATILRLIAALRAAQEVARANYDEAFSHARHLIQARAERDAVAQDLAQVATALREERQRTTALRHHADEQADELETAEARLAAVEALVNNPADAHYPVVARDDLRAALAAPTDTTKEN